MRVCVCVCMYDVPAASDLRREVSADTFCLMDVCVYVCMSDVSANTFA